MSTVHINLSRNLKSFQEADTASTSMGTVKAGAYVLLESKMNHPDANSDYSKVSVPDVGDVWICSRWKQDNYAEVIASHQPETDSTSPAPSTTDGPVTDAPSASISLPRISFDDRDDSIPESELVSELSEYNGYSYASTDARYPYKLKGITINQGPPNQNNCCTFVEGMLVKSWADNFPDFEWNNKRHNQMMVMGADLFSPVAAAVESGMAVKVDDVEAPPQPWTIIQGWKEIDPPKGGHTFFIVDHHAETDRVLTLESNMALGLDGVGFRKIGMASDFGNKPPANWWENEAVWTWEKMKNSFKFRAMATLKVKNRSWSGIA